MANLKQLKSRIAVVNSTKKITSAMKMVAAAKLRRSQEALSVTRPYSDGMTYLVRKLVSSVKLHDPNSEDLPQVITGNGSDKKHLLLVISSDKGLCGGFNSSVVKLTRSTIRDLQKNGKEVKLLFVGKKARDSLIREFGSLELKETDNVKLESSADKNNASSAFLEENVGTKIALLFEKGVFDCCSMIFNRFISTISQKPAIKRIIPLDLETPIEGYENETPKPGEKYADYDFEPNEKEILEKLLPDYMQNLVSRIVLESFVAECAARMTSMDAATRNAKEMINTLQLLYNRTRQSKITTELTEIISGAEAL